MVYCLKALPMDYNDRTPKLISVFLLGFVIFNFPILNLFSRMGLLLGLPPLYLYILTAWAGLITLTAWITRPHRKTR